MASEVLIFIPIASRFTQKWTDLPGKFLPFSWVLCEVRDTESSVIEASAFRLWSEGCWGQYMWYSEDMQMDNSVEGRHQVEEVSK